MAVAIGFDLGETLLTYAGTPLSWSEHYEPALRRATDNGGIAVDAEMLGSAARILARYNTRLHPREVEISAPAIFDEILAGWNLPLSHNRALTEAFFDYFQQRAVAYPDSATTLEELKRRGHTLGILTDVPYGLPRHLVERDLESTQLSRRVDVVLTSTEVGFRKPRPDGFAALAHALRAESEEFWYVGNEQKDIAGANAAGAVSVLIDREKRRPAWGQRHTISGLRELLTLI